MWESKVAPLSGLLSVVLLVVGVSIMGNFDFMPPSADIVAFYGEESGRIMAGGYMGLLSAFFLLWFAGSVRTEMSRVEKDSTRLGTIAFGGGVVAAAMLALSNMANFYGAERVTIQGEIDPATATALFDLASGAVGTVAPYGFAALIGGYAVLALRSSSQPAWLTWSSLVIAVGLISPINWLVLGFGVVWVAVTSVRFYRQGGSRHQADTGLVESRA